MDKLALWQGPGQTGDSTALSKRINTERIDAEHASVTAATGLISAPS